VKQRISGRIIFIILTALTVLAFAPQLSWAQTPKIASLKISVMPEYDDPRVLAVYEAKMSPETQLPLEARFIVPKSAPSPQIGMACEVPEGQGHNCKVYNTKKDGDNTDVTYKVEESRNLFWEYYYDPFNGKVGDKSFTFDYVPAYDVGHLEIQVTEPKTANGFKLNPASNAVGTSNEGLKTHSYTFDNIKKNQPITINASYVKNDSQTSVTKQTNATPDQNQDSQAPGNGRGRIASILALALVIIGGGVSLSIWRAKTAGVGAAKQPMPRPKAAVGKGAKRGRPTTKKAAGFCSNCGVKVERGANFCSKCGHNINA